MAAAGKKANCSLLLGGVGLFCGGSAHAADTAQWIVSPVATVMANYASNPRLLEEGALSTTGAIGDFSVTLKNSTEYSEVSLQPRFRVSRYRDDEALDSDDQYLDLRFDQKSERAEWAGTAGFARDSTLTSELGTTGIVQANRRHSAMTLTAGPTFTFSERLNGGAQVYWQNNRYDDAAGTGLVDYEYRALTLFSGFSWTDLSTLTATLQAGDLLVPDQSSHTRNATLRLGWRYQPDALWSMDLSAGPAFVESDYGRDDGVVYEAKLERNTQRWHLKAGFGRQLAPTGRGVLVKREQMDLALFRRFTERLRGGVSVNLVRNQDLLPQSDLAFERVDYGRIDARLSWQLSRSWSLAVTAGTAIQEHTSRAGRAENQQASLSFVWNGQPRSL